MADEVNRAYLEDFQAAVDAGDLGRVLPALTVLARGGECRCGGATCSADCPQHRFEQLAPQALHDLAQRVTAGQLPLAHGTLGAMQLLALMRESLRWDAHAAAAAFAAFAGTDGAPPLPLAWWRDLLCMALSSAVQQQLPAIQSIAARCNEAAARVGKPALPPAPTQRSAIPAALSESLKQRQAGLFPALTKILASLSGIADHVSPVHVGGACSIGCVHELLQLGPPPSPGASQQLWQEVLSWGRRMVTIHLGRTAAHEGTPASERALPVYLRLADALDALVAAGHRPQHLWGVQVQLGQESTAAQRLATYDSLMAAQPDDRFGTLRWLAALAASGLEWTPDNHRRWPPAVQQAVIAAFGTTLLEPARLSAADGSPPKRRRTAAELHALRQLPTDVQQKIARLVVHPITQWLPVKGGVWGEPPAVSC